jgi:hypothetical protein
VNKTSKKRKTGVETNAKALNFPVELLTALFTITIPNAIISND